jgi:hypothetical protein
LAWSRVIEPEGVLRNQWIIPAVCLNLPDECKANRFTRR